MTEISEMSSLSSVLASLRKKGYGTALLMTMDGLTSEAGRLFAPGELRIIKTYRFEGASDPSEEAIVYLLEANDGFIGYSIDAYGVYTNHTDSEGYATLIREMIMKDRKEQQIY